LKRHYFDAAYVAKCYLHEPDAIAVRKIAASSEALHTSALSLAEVSCVFHRHRREGALDKRAETALRNQFLDDIENEHWILLPVTEYILRRVEAMTRSLPSGILLRAGDAVHIATALDGQFADIWSNDRRFLAAAEHLGLVGRTV
jgi:predicted nucleic acid-binding protein